VKSSTCSTCMTYTVCARAKRIIFKSKCCLKTNRNEVNRNNRWILCFVERASDYILCKLPTSSTIIFRIFVYSNSLHVSNDQVLIIRRVNCINTTFGVCHSMQVTVWYAGAYHTVTYIEWHQMSYWYNWLSWWWAPGCSKHVENWNKYVVKETN